MAVAGVVEEEAGDLRAPIIEHLNQRTTVQVRQLRYNGRFALTIS
jgi:hypothetical protein